MSFERAGSFFSASKSLSDPVISGRCFASISSQVESMNWPAPPADEREFCAFGSPPDSTPTIRSAMSLIRFRLYACLALFALAMTGVSFAAHGIVGHFGVIGGLLTLPAMYFPARHF